jgi:hypothetical protein
MQNNRERILAFLETSDIDLEGDAYMGKYELERESIKTYLKGNLRGVAQNKNTGDFIAITRESIKKLVGHGLDSEVYMKSLIHIKKIIEEMSFIAEMLPDHPKPNFEGYRYYMLGLSMYEKSYTLLGVVGTQGNLVYYDQNIFDAEKRDLFKKIDDAGARVKTTDDIIHFPKVSRIVKIWQGEF